MPNLRYYRHHRHHRCHACVLAAAGDAAMSGIVRQAIADAAQPVQDDFAYYIIYPNPLYVFTGIVSSNMSNIIRSGFNDGRSNPSNMDYGQTDLESVRSAIVYSTEGMSAPTDLDVTFETQYLTPVLRAQCRTGQSAHSGAYDDSVVGAGVSR
jgi:hypothetical protein